MDAPPNGKTNDDCPYEWLSEWLCEYVDGTMDPSVRAVFDEYLEANPELSRHVERLCEMRTLLRQCQEDPDRVEGRHQRAEAMRKRLCQQLESEMMQARGPVSDDLGTVAAVASGMTVMLVVGMIVGASLFRSGPGEAGPVQASERTERVDARQDRSPVAARALYPAAHFAPEALTSRAAFSALAQPRISSAETVLDTVLSEARIGISP